MPIGIGTCANFAKGSFTALLLETAVTASGHSNVYVCGLGLQHTAAASGNKELQRFDRWLLDIGNGKSDSIFIPGNMVATLIKPKLEDKAMTEFCRKIFPKLEENFNDPDYLNGRVILAPTNNEVAMLNSRVLKMLPGEVETFRSGDELAASEDLLRFNIIFKQPPT